MNKPALVVLAAGMGSRYGGLKQLDKFGPSGETIIEYSVYDAIRAGFGKVVFVIRKDFEEDFRAVLGSKFADKIEVRYVFQELDKLPEGFNVPEGRVKPWGTGHALLMAADVVDEPFAVINADDFYGKGAFEVIGSFLSNLDNSSKNYCIVGYQVKNTLSEFGSVSRGVCETDTEGNLTGITERTKIFQKDGGIVFEEEGNETPLAEDQAVSMNLMGFAPSAFDYYNKYFTNFLEQKGNEEKSEFYMPFVLNELIATNEATVKVVPCTERWFGVTYKEDRPNVVAEIQKLIDEGVYPSNLWK